MKNDIILYLIRHADAVQQSPDRTRPLSSKGEESARRMGAWLAACKLAAPHRVLHSGLVRAEQTARIIADACGWPAPAAAKNLKPNDDCQAWIEQLAEEPANLAIVSHMPFVGALAAALLCGDPGGMLMDFKKMSVAALERQDGVWSLRWFIRPALIP